ncbi:hypothetical protein G9272_32325 [Streptomyces asoensis]|uniref:Uncharacterized protein n=1 Tax=Streptomyces asoensis TaxID=249586 RepID=A0A6M4WYG7_9ACTN|nr:hypothetical protein [Streptomyces asoensis]QJT04405.1 hypothetical protein G9272_32325 [Streptomyces asoensis]
MTDNSVRGPMYIEATPLMVTADVEPLVHANVGELLDLLSGEFFEEFTAMVCEETPRDADERNAQKLAFETLQARLVERMSTKVALTGPQAMRVAARMAKLAKPLADLSAKTAAVVMRGASLIKHPTHAATRRHLKANPLPTQQDRRSA